MPMNAPAESRPGSHAAASPGNPRTMATVSPSLTVPAATRPFTVNRVYAGTILAVHLLALLAFMPQFFSWIGFWAMVVGIHVFGQIGRAHV